MTNAFNRQDTVGPFAGRHLHDLHEALRSALLWAGLACMVESALSPWYLRIRIGYREDELEALSLMGVIVGPDSLGPAKIYLTIGVALTITLWLCALGRVGAYSERVDAGTALLTALAALMLITSHAALISTIDTITCAGLPLMLLSVAFNGVCAVKLRRS